MPVSDGAVLQLLADEAPAGDTAGDTAGDSGGAGEEAVECGLLGEIGEALQVDEMWWARKSPGGYTIAADSDSRPTREFEIARHGWA